MKHKVWIKRVDNVRQRYTKNQGMKKFTPRSEKILDNLSKRFVSGQLRPETYLEKVEEANLRFKKNQGSRNIWTEKEKIPPGSSVLGIRVRSPQIIFATPEDEGKEVFYGNDPNVLSTEKMVFVEITPEERAKATDEEKINKLAQSLTGEVAAKLGLKHTKWDK